MDRSIEKKKELGVWVNYDNVCDTLIQSCNNNNTTIIVLLSKNYWQQDSLQIVVHNLAKRVLSLVFYLYGCTASSSTTSFSNNNSNSTWKNWVRCYSTGFPMQQKGNNNNVNCNINNTKKE